MIDLHVHTNDDDAKNPPEVILDAAEKYGVTALALMVHDYVGHIENAVSLGTARGIETFASTELSAKNGHYILLFPDFRAAHDEDFKARLQTIYDARRDKLEGIAWDTQQNPYMIDVPGHGIVEFVVHMEDLDELAPHGRVLSGHLSELLYKQSGGAVAGRVAYDLIRPHLPRKSRDPYGLYNQSMFSIEELLELKERFDALVIQAHPPGIDERQIDDKLFSGIDGFELSPKSTVEYNLGLYEQSKKKDFLITMGTDNHMWETDVLGFLNWQSELASVVDEGKIIDAINERLDKKY